MPSEVERCDAELVDERAELRSMGRKCGELYTNSTRALDLLPALLTPTPSP